MKTKREKRIMRKKRIRATLAGNASRPRLSFFRSNRFLSVQLIDDEKGRTLLSFSDRDLRKKGESRLERAKRAGQLFAQKALTQGVTQAVCDRSGYAYHGAVKAFAQAARASGLES